MSIFAILYIGAYTAFATEYDSNGPLVVKRIEFSVDKPRGLGHLTAKEGNEFRKGEDEIYLYIEVANCKPVREANLYHTRLAIDVDIYYEDGILVFSEDEANVFDYQTTRRSADAYLWAKIDAKSLKPGEYKVEVIVRDENTNKEAFTLTRFTRLDETVHPAGGE